jgi:hypothetical protein
MMIGHIFILELSKDDKPNQKGTLILFYVCDERRVGTRRNTLTITTSYSYNECLPQMRLQWPKNQSGSAMYAGRSLRAGIY